MDSVKIGSIESKAVTGLSEKTAASLTLMFSGSGM